MLVINSHQPLTGPVAWYEAHVQSDEGLNVMGGLFPGAPAVGVGFTSTTAWGATVNQPDLVDVYKLEMNPSEDYQYRYDDQWLELERKDVEIDVLIWGFIPWSVTETVYRSVHGPVLESSHGWYAVRYAGMDELRQVEQWLAMNKARNFEEWRAAVALNYIQSFNFVYAGKDQTIYFVHNATMPERARGWQWQQYLPGNRSELVWQSYLPFDELPHIENPASGFILSTNQSPFHISAPGSNPDINAYPVESGWPTRMTNRAVRGLELFEGL
jgi:penicillin amidase/acyl-homoserine-lactone acylase